MNFVVLLSILAEAALLSSVSYLRFTLQEDPGLKRTFGM